MGGYVSLLCMFDPAPTGAESHKTGAYSDYGDLNALLGTPEHTAHLQRIAKADAMIDGLSLARARGAPLTSGPLWDRYQEGLKAQRALETSLKAQLETEGRASTIARWTLPEDNENNEVNDER